MPTSKRERSIPIKVSVDPRPAPTNLPPVHPTELQPKVVAPPAIKKQAQRKISPIKAAKIPIHEWPEERRRKLMWWLVGGGMTVIVIGWLALVRFELKDNGDQNLFSEAKKLFSTLRWPGTTKSTAAEQEIRQLDNQVFPQFNQ